jgi:hypothetical protein
MIRIRSATRCISSTVLTAAAVLLPSAIGYAQLARVVPEEAFMITHRIADEDMAFMDEYTMEVLQALHDAKFDDLLIEVLESGGMTQEVSTQLRTLRDVVTTLVHRVDWVALTQRESVFAMDMRPMLPWIPGVVPSALMAFSPDPEKVPDLEKALQGLMATVAAIAPDFLAFEKLAREDAGSRIYSLSVRPWNDLPVLQIAVRGNEFIFVLGDSFFRDALARLEGTSGTSLIDTERYAAAFGELSRAAPHSTFIDVAQAIDDVEAQVLPLIGDPYANQMDRQIAEELFDLIRVVDTVAQTAHAEGYTVVGEQWVRFDDRAVEGGNPLYLACCAPSDNNLLDFVPAEASSFSMMKGLDLGPLYRFTLDRVEHYGGENKDVEEGLVNWATAQAVLNLDFEEDILSILASDSITIQVPAVRPTAMKPEDYVVLVDLENPTSTRSLVRRFENVYEAYVPWFLEDLSKREPGIPLPSFEIEDARGMFPGMKHFSMTMRLPWLSIPMPEVTYGMVGNMLVLTSSQDALALVMEAGAGEIDGLAEHPAFASGDRLPEGPITWAAMVPYASQLDEMKAGFQMATASLNFGLKEATKHNGNSEVKAMVKAVSGLMPRISRILERVDFLEDGVSYAQFREVDPAMYTRTTTRYRAPAERPRFPSR